MVETNLGIGDMEDLTFGMAVVTPYDNSHARLGLGDGNGIVPTVAATDVALTATTNKIFKGMNSSYPSRVGTAVSFQSTYATTEANFTVNEWGLDNGAGGGPGHLFVHKAVALGTKVNTATWVFTAGITQS